MENKKQIKVYGEVKKGYEKVKETFIENFQELKDIGSSCCLFVKGEKVVDIWAGYAIKPSKTEPNAGKDIINDTGREWKADTLVNVFSCAKVLSNICIFKLQEKGVLKITDKVSTHWPNFGKNGKENITIEQLITHRAGLPYFEEGPVKAEILKDWFENHIVGHSEQNEFTLILENQKPIWPIDQPPSSPSSSPPSLSSSSSSPPSSSSSSSSSPPSSSSLSLSSSSSSSSSSSLSSSPSPLFGYHPLTIGFYISELLIRVDTHRRGIQQFFAEEIAAPLNSFLSSPLYSSFSPFQFEFYFGFGGGELYEQTTKRMAKFYNGAIPDQLIANYPSHFSESTPPISDLFVDGTHATNAFRAVEKFSPFRLREIEVGSALGYTNARSLAFFYSTLSLSLSDLPFPKLFRKDTVEEMIDRGVEGFDLIIGANRKYARGGFLLNEKYPTCFYHKGTGGSVGLGDSKYLIGFSYTTNALQVDSHTLRTDRLIDSVYECLSALYPSAKL